MQTTTDSICRGELTLRQPREGYRFNVDSVILAQFAWQQVAPAPRQLVDLGAGCGVVGLLLGRRWPGCLLSLVEIQPELAALARENARLNGLQRRATVHCADLRQPESWLRAAPQLAVSNPPFFALGRGRINPGSQQAAARHELSCSLEHLLETAARVLADGGQLALIHLARRWDEVRALLADGPLAVERYRMVLPLPGRDPSRVLLLARRGAERRPPEEIPPLLVEQRPGCYSAEMLRVLEGEPAPGSTA